MPRTTRPFRAPQAAALQFLCNVWKQLFDRKFLQILRVEPFQFRTIEHGIGPAHVFQAEAFDELACAKKLCIATRRPAQQSQEIAERLTKKACLAVRPYTRA